MLTPVSQGGGRTDVMPVSLCGGGPIEAWTENHTGCARKAPYCVISTNNIPRDPADLTSPITRTTHLSELIVMRGNGTEIRRVAQTRSPNFTNDNYWSLARASMSQDGSLVAWDSNFGYPNRGEVVAMAYTGYGPIYPPPLPPPPPPPGPFTPIRVHSGGAAYTDLSGRVWSADTGYADGSTYSVTHAISGTSTPALYQTERNGNFQYQFAVPNGAYTVNLKFAETSMTQAGQRVFNVDVNGNRVLKNFDIIAAAGAPFTAIDRSFPVTTTTGYLMIQFSSTVNFAKISSIEIFQGSAPPPPPPPSSTIRVNAGGPAYTDSSGNVWSADTNYAGGSLFSTTAPIKNTITPVLYQTERYGNSQYQFSVPNGTYSVNLKFAEIFMTQRGQRVFNVAINGTAVLTNFDIIAAAGAPFTAIDKPFTVSTTTGTITIQLTTVVNNAKISAIEIVPGTAPPPPASTIRVNAGGAAYTDSSGNVWSADTGYAGGSIYTTTLPIKNTSSQTLYQTERWASTFQYQFSVPNGTHTVNLKFAEIFMTQPGQRIFNVAINGSPVLTNFDIVAQAGSDTAIDKAFSVTTTTGSITIQFTSVVDHAKISAIEIY